MYIIHKWIYVLSIYSFKPKNTVYNWYCHIIVDIYGVFEFSSTDAQVNTVNTVLNVASVEYIGQLH